MLLILIPISLDKADDKNEQLLTLYTLIENTTDILNLFKLFTKYLIDHYTAHKVYLIHEYRDYFTIEEYFDKNTTVNLKGKSIDSMGETPAKIIRFCLRTKEDFITSNNDGNDLNDKNSIICLPIVKNNDMLSLLYIEKSGEIEVIRLVSRGHTYTQIADLLTLSPNTVKWYAKNIYNKFSVSKKATALKVAEKEGYLN